MRKWLCCSYLRKTASIYEKCQNVSITPLPRFLIDWSKTLIYGQITAPGRRGGVFLEKVVSLRKKHDTRMKPIKTSNAPEAIGPYSQAVDSGTGLVFLSGQLPIDPATGAFPEGGVKEQTRQSLLNVAAILREAGLGLGNVVKTTVFLSDMGDFAAMNEVYAEFFSAPFPARSAVAVKALPKGALVEIECIAVR